MVMTIPTTFKNPLEETLRDTKIVEPCILVIFGATGDLTARKLLPALYNLELDGQIPPHFACVGFARRDKSHTDFRNEMHESIDKFSRTHPINEDVWNHFSEKIFYHCSDFDRDDGYDSLNEFLKQLDSQYGTKGNRVFYLSTPPRHFPLIIKKLSQHELIYDVSKVKDRWSRVIIEKPFGKDLSSAISLQDEITQHLDESQIYRIDHYLGKETVQNLMVLRFSNPFFESLWNNHYIDNIQITVAEDIGIETRGHFFEGAGILRDIVQNHMMQLLSLVAMEPPRNLRGNVIRDEKVKVLESIRPVKHEDFSKYFVRGQYGPGYINGDEVPGYREEPDVSPTSNIETYAAMQLFIDNWRWAGVPFYLRAGKRLAKRVTEIAITYKTVPGFLFQTDESKNEHNVLVIRIQPDEGISLKMNCKVPGLASPIQPVKMDFRYHSYFGSTPPEAYERLICDCMAGDNTLFARIDEVLASWRFFTPVLEYWQEKSPDNFPNYQSGSWGPNDAERLLSGKNRTWRLP